MKPESVASIPHWLVRMSWPAFVGTVVPFIDGSDCMKVAIVKFLYLLFDNYTILYSLTYFKLNVVVYSHSTVQYLFMLAFLYFHVAKVNLVHIQVEVTLHCANSMSLGAWN